MPERVGPPRRARLRAGLLRAGLRLLPGLVFLLAWQWASGRLVRAAYVSRPTEIAARLVQIGRAHV